MSHRTTLIAAVAALSLASTAPAFAVSAFYDFESQTPGAATPLSITNNGLTATFSSPSDPGFYSVGNTGGLFAGLTGQDLSYSGYSPDALVISFSAPIGALSFNFGLLDIFGIGGNDTLTLTTNTGGATTATARVVSGYAYPEGFLSYTGPSFTTATLTSAYDIAIDNVSVPEPATLGMLGVGLAGLLASRRRRAA